MKIKDKPIHVVILITEVALFSEYRTLIQTLFFREENLTIFKELSPETTQITFQICVLGFLVPFFKSALLKNVQKVYAKMTEAFQEHFASDLS